MSFRPARLLTAACQTGLLSNRDAFSLYGRAVQWMEAATVAAPELAIDKALASAPQKGRRRH